MDDQVIQAMKKWPNVPELFGWLALDRRGRWQLEGAPVTRRQIKNFIDRNYAVDEQGRWFFQNGPQRVYVRLACTPWVLHVIGGQLVTHTRLLIHSPYRAYLDEKGHLLINTEHGPGLLIDTDTAWALAQLRGYSGGEITESELFETLALPSNRPTRLHLQLGDRSLAIFRLDSAETAAYLGFQRVPSA